MNYYEDPARSSEHLDFPAHLSFNDMPLKKKSSNLSKTFMLTTMASESVRWFLPEQDSISSNFHNFLLDLHNHTA